MAYTQQFVSLGNETFTLCIEGVTLPTGATTPPLAADPFETDEDSDTDMFLPVRTQVGTISMVAMDASSWRSFIPVNATDKPVTLTDSQGTVVWQGYLQPDTYGTTFPATYEDVELPVIDILGTLESFDVDITGPSEMVSIGQLLAYIFGKLTGLTVSVAFHTASVSSFPGWLQYLVTWRNFLSEDGDELRSRFTCLGLLQELCKFFGWSCRSMGQTVYFTSITDDHCNTRTITYTLAQLATASGGTGAAMQWLTLTNGMFATNAHSEEFVAGIKKATVNSELNAYDILSEVPEKELYTNVKWNTPTLVYRKKARTSKTYKAWMLASQGISGYEDSGVVLSTYAEHTDGSDANNQCFGRLVIFDEDAEDEEKTKYSWTVAIECFHGVAYGNRVSSTPLFQIETKASHIISNGVLYLNSTQCDLDDIGQFAEQRDYTYATCTLRIGTDASGYKYWNGSSWVSTATTFELHFGTDGILDKNANVAGAEYSGYGINVSQTLNGTIYFAVNDVFKGLVGPVATANGYFPLIGFEIGFIRAYEDTVLNDKNYIATGGAFPENYDVDTIFSTDKTKMVQQKQISCQLGYGLLFSDTQIIDTIPYGGDTSLTYLKPEQHTADLIAAYGSQPRRVLTVDLRTSDIGHSVGPAHIIILGSQTFYPVAVGHRWRDDITTLTLMNL